MLQLLRVYLLQLILYNKADSAAANDVAIAATAGNNVGIADTAATGVCATADANGVDLTDANYVAMLQIMM